MQETQVQFLGWEDPLEEGMVTHSSILPWRIARDRGAWRATVHGVAESDTTERLTLTQLYTRDGCKYLQLCKTHSLPPRWWQSNFTLTWSHALALRETYFQKKFSASVQAASTGNSPERITKLNKVLLPNFVFDMRRNWGGRGGRGKGRNRWPSHGTSTPPTSCQNYMPKKDITYPSGIRLLLNHFLVAQMVKYLPTMQETQVQSLGWEDPLEKEKTTTPVFLPGEFLGQMSLEHHSPWGCKELDTTRAIITHTHTHTHTHTRIKNSSLLHQYEVHT